MPYDDPDDDFDDEDWQDEDDEELVEEVAAQCPECGAPVYMVTRKCPACGYWVSQADRRRFWPGESQPAWVKATALILLLILLAGLLATVQLF